MKFLIRYGWIILLLGVTACGTATPMSPVEVQMTSMAAQAQACATLQAIGTPYPCNPPTATSTPQPTPTMPPTPTATPFTGWMYYPESGGATPMPYGFEPLSCDNKVVGCPGQSYRYFVNGVPQGPDANTYKGTPSYWPWALVGTPIAIVIIAILIITAWGNTAPQRAIAKVTVLMGEALAGSMLSNPQQANQAMLASPNAGIPVEVLAQALVGFMNRHEVPPEFKPEIGKQLSTFKKGQVVPLEMVQTMLLQFDTMHGSNVAKSFGKFLAHSVKRNEKESR